LPRAIILAAGIAAALAAYFVISLYVVPLSYLEGSRPLEPEAIVSEVEISSDQLVLGEEIAISVNGRNDGEMADMQIISIGFPNLTAGSEIEVVRHDFRQTPLIIDLGDPVGSAYAEGGSVSAQYPSVEAFSRPWEGGAVFTVELRAKPLTEGNFVILVKAVAFPHSWDGAHYPRDGLVDYQQEFVEAYTIRVTKS
jgi:hypothetical protein